MRRPISILSLLTIFSASAALPATADSMIGLGTTVAGYCIAKGSQQLWDAVPTAVDYITRDHTACVVLGAVMIPLAIVYHKKVLAGKSKQEKTDCIARYTAGMSGGAFLLAGIEMYLNWNSDWQTTLFPTFTSWFSSKKS